MNAEQVQLAVRLINNPGAISTLQDQVSSDWKNVPDPLPAAGQPRGQAGFHSGVGEGGRYHGTLCSPPLPSLQNNGQ